MSGFLEYLVQRSLTASVGVRPRPVSIFESIQPSPVTDPPHATMFEMGRDFSAGDPMQFDWRPASKLDPESQNTTPAMISASPTHADESGAASEKAPRPEPRVGSLVEEEKLRPAVAEPGQRGTRTMETLQGREKPEAHRTPGETLVHSMSRPDTVDSASAMRSRPLQVEGKLVAQSISSRSEMHPVTTVPAQESFTTMAEQVQVVHPNTQKRAAAESELRTRASPPHEFRSAPREEVSHPVQAILTPRLQQQPLVQSVQPSPANPAEPVVHVTIGRVEIRAVTAPAATKRSTQLKPALSLSDYLDRRSGGQR